MWKGRISTYKILKVWGCLAKVWVPLPKKTKLGPKTVDCAFIGYANNGAVFRFLIVKSKIVDVHVNTILESVDAEFFEKIFPYKENKLSSSKKRSHEQIHDDAQPTSDVHVRLGTKKKH